MALSQPKNQKQRLWAIGLKAQSEGVARQCLSSFLALFPPLGIGAFLIP